jgi:hypothetical protein
MNERIRKLMDGCFDITVDSRGREECTADFINVQRFAELIIAECCDQVRAIDAMTIRQHFGVEE